MPKILVTDDEVKVLELLGVILKKNGFDCETATNGQEALQKIKTHPPDLILLDIEMPGMAGYEVCKSLKEDAVFQEIPVIVITGFTDKDSKLKALSMGAKN